jgi:hypothetical protein
VENTKRNNKVTDEQLYQQYLAETGQDGKPDANVVQKMPDWLSLKDRAILKNFSNSPKASVKYLQLKYPDKQFRLGNEGEVLARGQGEDWGTLDPDMLKPKYTSLGGVVYEKPNDTSWGDVVKEAGMDALDMAYDIPAGLAQGLATTAGAAVGAATPVPGGALMGGSAASGASGAGLEYLRQKLGQKLGIPQDVDKGQITSAGVSGAAIPLTLGIGEVGGKPVEGLLSKGLKKMGSLASGIPVDTMQAYAKHMNKVDELEKTGATSYIMDINKRINDYVQANKTKAGKAVASEIDNLEGGINIADIKKAWLDKINEAESKAMNEAGRKQAAALRAQYNEFMEGMPDTISGSQAFDLQQQLKQGAKYNQTVDDATKYAKTEGTRNAYSGLNDEFNKASDNTIGAAKNQYRAALDEEKSLDTNFNGSNTDQTAQKTFNTVTNLDKEGKRALKERLQKLSDSGQLDLTNDVETLQALKAFGNPSSMPISSGGTTSTSRSIPLSILGGGAGAILGGKLAGWPGVVTGSALGSSLVQPLASPQAMKNYIKMATKAGKLAKPLHPLQPYMAPAYNEWELLQEQQQQQP